MCTALKKDYVDELDLYNDAGRLVTFLQNWAFLGSSLPEAIVQLSQDMATAGFWLQSDADLAGAWVEVRFNLCSEISCECNLLLPVTRLSGVGSYRNWVHLARIGQRRGYHCSSCDQRPR